MRPYHLWNDRYPDAWLRDEILFEEKRVEMLLAKLGLTEHTEELMDDFEMTQDTRQLSFHSFSRLFPTFPWHLTTKYRRGVDAIGYSHDIEKALLRGKFGETSIWYWYCELLDDLAAELTEKGPSPRLQELARKYPLGLIFPAPGVAGGLILHNAKAQTRNHHVFEARDHHFNTRSCCIERYHDWLAAVSQIAWSPTTTEPQLPEIRWPPFYVPGALIEPWMPNLVGTNATGIVFGFLVRVLFWGASDERIHHLLSRERGELCLKANAKELARLTGVSERQARSALTTLRKKRLIYSDSKVIQLDQDRIYASARRNLPSLFEPPYVDRRRASVPEE